MATEIATLFGSALAAREASSVAPCDDSPAARIERFRERLTTEQQLFAEQYCETLDAVACYRLAYDCKQLTPASVHMRAYALLDKWFIREYMSAVCEADGIDAVLCTRAEIMERLKEIMANGSDKERVRAAEILLGQLVKPDPPGGNTLNVQVNINERPGLSRSKLDEIRTMVLGVPTRNTSVADKEGTE